MSVQTYRVSREGDRLLSPHFRVREFACRDGSDLVKIDTDLVELLERGRLEYRDYEISDAELTQRESVLTLK